MMKCKYDTDASMLEPSSVFSFARAESSGSEWKDAIASNGRVALIDSSPQQSSPLSKTNNNEIMSMFKGYFEARNVIFGVFLRSKLASYAD